MLRIEVERWSFWSPESGDPGQWSRHWQQADAHAVEGAPNAELIPAMQRRRTSRLSKMALAVALEVAAGEPIDYSIFCSQHGEIVRTQDILEAISEGTEISPTAFAQSVHNTSSGLFTILASSNAPSMSMASGANTFAYGWMEAQAYLAANPAQRVLLVDVDEVIPEKYRPYSTQVDCDHALAMLLRVAERDGISMTGRQPGDEQALPQGPQFLSWLQSDEASLSLTSDGQGWQWER